MKAEWIELDAIDVGPRRRPIDRAHVDALAQSIKEIGLQTPISVVRHHDGRGSSWFTLVAGAHRLEAVRQLGQEGVECFVFQGDDDLAELWEIEENFARKELTDAQRADHHARREEILVRRGEVKSKPGPNSDKLSLTSYAAQAASSLGVNKRTVERDLRRGKNITPEVLAEVSVTDMDKGVVLDQLAATPSDQQSAKLAALRAEREAREQEAKEVQRRNRSADVLHSQDACETAARMVVGWADYDGLTQLIALISDRRMTDFVAALRREMSDAPVMDRHS